MSRLSSRGYSAQDAADFRTRANGPHTLRWKASSYRWSGGVEHLLYDDLPLVGGTLSLDASDPTRRKLTLDVGGGEALVPVTSADPLAPFGQLVKLWCRIDRADGSWFPWLKHGEFPIVTVTSEWPSLVQTVECQDYSSVVDDYLHTKKKSYNHLTVHNALKQITEAALPDKVFAIHSEDHAKTIKVEPNSVAESGSSRWETATMIAQARGFETFFDWDGDLVIRDDVTDDQDETIPAVGPDIGTVTNPIATIRDGAGGNLVALTVAVTREGACNAVFINIHETASQTLRAKKKKLAGDKRVNVQVSALGDGAIAWGDKFGRVPIVMERQVKLITDDIVAAQRRRARRLLNRRGGVVRTVDLDAVGLYWLEADDKVRIVYHGVTEAMYVASIEFDLSGQSPARIRCRSLSVTDPG
jgi:hypothetical protein